MGNEVLAQMFDSDDDPEAIVSARGFKQVSDPNALESLIDKVLAEQATTVADFRSGQGKALGFLVGQVMQASDGKANPKLIRGAAREEAGRGFVESSGTGERDSGAQAWYHPAPL